MRGKQVFGYKQCAFLPGGASGGHVVGCCRLLCSPCPVEATFPPRLKQSALPDRAQLEEALLVLAVTLAKGLGLEGGSTGRLETVFMLV